MKEKYWICAQFFPNGKFSHYCANSFHYSRKGSIQCLVDSHDNTTWEQFKKYGVKCIHITIEPIKP